MNPQDPLAQLRDIHLPPAITWWPPAPGWWILTIVLLAALVFGLRWLIKRRAHNYYRSEALRHLETLSATVAQEKQNYCCEILALLRRTAKTAYPGLAISSEANTDMLALLNQCCKTPVFDQPLQTALGTLPYQKNPEIPPLLTEQLANATKQWIKQHRSKAPLC